ncbi:heparinase II/III family protein [Yoonia vestfoldensis]|uniref:heparinase II/III family protein n=1 Tax=Yoonia vestfoldensis TaxID=245188 RepID=UPI0005BD71D9|nr:heparinase II/III family protein [Yoonia vestfoldensis]
MAEHSTWRGRLAAFFERHHAKRAGRAAVTTTFALPPEPRRIGLIGKGRQLTAGEFLFSGLRITAPELSIWDIAPKRPDVMADIHRCDWLDDLAALGDDAARAKAQVWVFAWIARFGAGTGPGWQVGITARRLRNWIDHSDFLLRKKDKTAQAAFMQSLAQQALFLGRRWQHDTKEIPTIADAINVWLTLNGTGAPVDQAVQALATACRTQVDETGAIASRNPASLLAILSDLVDTAATLTAAGRPLPPDITQTIDRIVPVLRGLRHADGALGRFHGGGRGAEGQLDAALAGSGVKTPATQPTAMGFARLTGGRTTLIVDAAAPPVGAASRDAHASTLGLELTSGRRPLIVNCGSGARFGDDWRRASRATPSHSTLGLDGASSSHLGRTSDEWLTDVPSLVRAEVFAKGDGSKIDLSHNGYQPTHGLTHARLLHLSADGRHLSGEDLLTTLGPEDEAQFDRLFDQSLRAGIRFAIRFHLHPDVTCTPKMDGSLVSLGLKSGEIWVFQHDGAAQLTISPSVYLENGQLKPRAAQQVVLSGSALSYATRVRWSFAKADNTPLAVRDLARQEPLDIAE